MSVLEYRVIGRLRSNGEWVEVKRFPTTTERTGGRIKRKFLWWTWEEDEEVTKTKKMESIDFAKTLLSHQDYQDVKVIEEVYIDSAYGDWASGTIWMNGRWV